MHTAQYKIGQEEMRERICALIAHHMEVAGRHHGKESDSYLRYHNLLEDIRIDHENEILEEKRQENQSFGAV